MNNTNKFALFYVCIICIALFGSLYSSHQTVWNRVVFTFPSEAQKIVENGTVVMEVLWRWLTEHLEIVVRVNDDGDIGTYPTSDFLGVLFDSDNNGVLLVKNERDGHFQSSPAFKASDDHIVYIAPNGSKSVSEVRGKAFVEKVEYPNLSRFYFSAPLIAQLNESYYVYNEDIGYEFFLSIPIETINVTSPTLIHLSFGDCGGVSEKWPPFAYAPQEYYIVSAEFEI